VVDLLGGLSGQERWVLRQRFEVETGRGAGRQELPNDCPLETGALFIVIRDMVGVGAKKTTTAVMSLICLLCQSINGF
jgi:hypothetical protein